MEQIFLVGSSGHAKVIVDIVEKQGKYKIAGLIDKYRNIGDETAGYRIIGNTEEDFLKLITKYSITKGLIAIGDNFTRNQVAIRIKKICPDFEFVTAIHPASNLAQDVTIGEGTVIMAGVTVSPCCDIGPFCILNTNSSLDHDSRMGEFSSIAPNVSTGGNVCIGAFAGISIGAILIHNINIGDFTIVGAGAVVLNDIDAYKIAYGTPAKVIKDRSPDDKYL